MSNALRELQGMRPFSNDINSIDTWTNWAMHMIFSGDLNDAAIEEIRSAILNASEAGVTPNLDLRILEASQT